MGEGKKKLLLIAYEYHGYHSKAGAALSRRVKQVAGSFAQNGWSVTVIHKDQVNETGNMVFCKKVESNSVERIVVKAPVADSIFEQPLLRRFFTLYYVLFKGDRSYRWAESVIACSKQFSFAKPDLIISFFTPKAPLFLGRYFSKRYGTPWIADLQDELDQGTVSTNKFFSAINRSLSRTWLRQVMTTSKAVVQVSPEWSEIDSNILERPVNCIRHAITSVDLPASTSRSGAFNIFYGGTVIDKYQDLSVLNAVLSKLPDPAAITITLACEHDTYTVFRQRLNPAVNIDYKGWLNFDDYKQCLANADCCLIVPWTEKDRQVIPSKFYEVCSVKPVWIVGEDSGAFSSLLKEWQHPPLELADVDFNVKGLSQAQKGDYSLMFTLDKCAEKPLREEELYTRYTQLVY